MPATGTESARARLVSAAEELFSEKGFDAAGISEIAQKAGVTKSLFYHYFRSKDDLLREIYEDFFEEAKQIRISFFERFYAGLQDWKNGFMAAILRFLADRQKVLRIIMRENLTGTPRIPILPYFKADFDQSFEAARKASRQPPDAGAWAPHAEERLMIMVFFFAFLPTLSFTLFSREFSEFFGIDHQELTRQYAFFFEQSYAPLLKLQTEPRS